MTTKGAKLKLYPVVIGVLSCGVLLLLVSRLIAPEQDQSTAPMPVAPTIAPPAVTTPTPQAERSPIVKSPSPTASPSATAASPVAPVSLQTGKLRVSNQTDLPVRVALLPQRPVSDNTNQAGYREPIHWDFAPQEGEQKGLLLTQPDGTAIVQTGDILVAFAQDGSRRYWGPYVIGRTNAPTWNADIQEWQLVLEP